MHKLDIDTLERHVSFKCADDVMNICQPLLTDFKISFFSYFKMYPDGTCLMLFSSRDWPQYWIKKQNAFIYAPSGVHLWSSAMNTEDIHAGANDFHHHNGVILSKHHTHFVEAMEFASVEPTCYPLELCCNRPDLLNQFIFYFKEKATKLIDQAEKERFIYARSWKNHTPNPSYQEFCKKAMMHQAKLYHNSSEVTVSKREYECLGYLAHGKTIKEIAGLLGISPKTVEFHLGNMKTKTFCHSTQRLIDLFHANQWI